MNAQQNRYCFHNLQQLIASQTIWTFLCIDKPPIIGGIVQKLSHLILQNKTNECFVTRHRIDISDKNHITLMSKIVHRQRSVWIS